MADLRILEDTPKSVSRRRFIKGVIGGGAAAGTGMVLTPGGQRLVGIASQMVNLAVEAEAAIRDAQGAPELLRVVATSTVARTTSSASAAP